MPNRKELQRLIENLNDTDIDVVAGIVLRMMTVTAEKWTGKIAFELNANQGAFGDTHVNKSEIIRRPKARSMRGSRG